MNPERTRQFLNVLSVEEVLALLDLKADKSAICPCCCGHRARKTGKEELNRGDAKTQRGEDRIEK